MTHGISEAGDDDVGRKTGIEAAVHQAGFRRCRVAKPIVGFIAAGHIGSQVARVAISCAYPMVFSNSRGPETLAELVAELGPNARAATAADVAKASRTPADKVVIGRLRNCAKTGLNSCLPAKLIQCHRNELDSTGACCARFNDVDESARVADTKLPDP
jgi:hypothetical protein